MFTIPIGYKKRKSHADMQMISSAISLLTGFLAQPRALDEKDREQGLISSMDLRESSQFGRMLCINEVEEWIWINFTCNNCPDNSKIRRDILSFLESYIRNFNQEPS